MLLDRVTAGIVYMALLAACGFPRPPHLDSVDSSVDVDSRSNVDSAVNVDGSINVDGSVGDDATRIPICTANEPLRCDGANLVKCNGDGTAEATESCLLGCNATPLHCNDVNPSNGLAQYLDMTAGEPDLDLGTSATIDTDTGTVTVDGVPVVAKSVTIAQPSAPSIRVFIAHGLTAMDVAISGRNAIAIVSNGDLKISRVFAASGHLGSPGAGGFNDGTCKGGNSVLVPTRLGGAGGGGFGFAGGRGGSATNINGTATGGSGGTNAGNAMLVPLRGGCDGGTYSGSLFGAGGGAIQFVSRTTIAVSGVIAANGSSGAGGGSGGGILLEAPIVELSGSVVANGGAGSGGCGFGPAKGEDGRLDATPATAGMGCVNEEGGNGGNGGAGNSGAGNGASVAIADNFSAVAGHGGGGVGRIRVNTAPGGLHTTGLFSPNPSTGNLATR